MTSNTSHPRLALRHALLPRVSRLLIASCIAALTLCASSSHVSAQQPEDEGDEDVQSAADDYARAINLYNEGKNREALQAFDAAISKSNEPVYLCNRAVVLITLEEYALAISDLKTCRDTYEMNDRERAYIDAQLGALSIFEYVIQPKSRAITERVANPPEERDNTITSTVTTPIQDSAPSSPTGSSSPLRAMGWVALGTGAGALIGVGALELITLQEVRTFRQECQGKQAPYAADCAMLQSTLTTQQKLSRALLISGGVLSITGAALLLISRTPTVTQAQRSWQLVPEISGHSATLRYQIAF